MTPLLAVGPECCFLPPLLAGWFVYYLFNAGRPPEPSPPPPPADPDGPPANWPAHWPR